jgi:hypothetical protein
MQPPKPRVRTHGHTPQLSSAASDVHAWHTLLVGPAEPPRGRHRAARRAAVGRRGAQAPFVRRAVDVVERGEEHLDAPRRVIRPRRCVPRSPGPLAPTRRSPPRVPFGPRDGEGSFRRVVAELPDRDRIGPASARRPASAAANRLNVRDPGSASLMVFSSPFSVDEDGRPHVHLPVQAPHVLVGHADAAVRHLVPEQLRLVGAVDRDFR